MAKEKKKICQHIQTIKTEVWKCLVNAVSKYSTNKLRWETAVSVYLFKNIACNNFHRMRKHLN